MAREKSSKSTFELSKFPTLKTEISLFLNLFVNSNSPEYKHLVDHAARLAFQDKNSNNPQKLAQYPLAKLLTK